MYLGDLLSHTHDIAISFGFEKTMKVSKLIMSGAGLEMQKLAVHVPWKRYVFHSRAYSYHRAMPILNF